MAKLSSNRAYQALYAVNTPAPPSKKNNFVPKVIWYKGICGAKQRQSADGTWHAMCPVTKARGTGSTPTEAYGNMKDNWRRGNS